MNKRIIASFTLFAFLSVGAAPAFAAPANPTPSDVVLERTWGDVEGRDGNIAPGSVIGYEQTVKVGPESGVTLAFPNGNRVRVSPDSEFRISNNEGQPDLYLVSGKILASANSNLRVRTFRTDAVSSTGEFVMTTSSVGTDLQVLSGNARMVSPRDGETTFQRLSSLPEGITNNALRAFDELKSHQVVSNEVSFGAQDQKILEDQTLAQAENSPPNGRGLEKGLRPDQDLTDNEAEAAAIVDGGSSTAAGSGSTGTTGTTGGGTAGGSGAAGGGAAAGGTAWPYVIGGIVGLGALIAIASNNEDEDPLNQGGNNFNVPSPSFP